MAVISSTAVAKTSKISRGQSQWVLIWREFRKRRLALCASAIILLLITTSIFAPLLANSSPIYYFGFNRFEYQEAARTLRATLTQLVEARQKNQPDTQYDRFYKTISLQVSIMSAALPADKATALRAAEQQIVATAQTAEASQAIAELKKLQQQIRSDFDAKAVTLVSQSHWPVIASLSGLDIFFLLANILVLSAPVWGFVLRRVVSIEYEKARKWAFLSILIGFPLLASTLWSWLVPVRVDRTEYKAGVLAADEEAAKAPVVYETAVWPPIVYGLDEYDLAGKADPPAWYPSFLRPAGKELASSKPTSRWSGAHWLGTDESGRDLFCRMIWGGRVSLSVGLVAVAIYVLLGIIIGALAGYFRGIVDLIVSRLIEVMICFPTFFLILTIVAFFGPNIMNIMLIIGLTGWTGIARLVRGEFLRLVDQEFVLAGRALGYTPTRIIFRHVLPNAMAPVLVSATFGIAGAILTESSLSFLGLGVSKPTPSWGALLYEGRDAMQRAPWLIHFPGLAIFITITAYNLIGEALRDASDPRLRGSR